MINNILLYPILNIHFSLVCCTYIVHTVSSVTRQEDICQHDRSVVAIKCTFCQITSSSSIKTIYNNLSKNPFLVAIWTI